MSAPQLQAGTQAPVYGINASGMMSGSQLQAFVLPLTRYLTSSSGGGQQMRLGLANTKLTQWYFQMAGEDAVTSGLWDTWNVLNSPDFNGTYYAGALNTPLNKIYIHNVWQV